MGTKRREEWVRNPASVGISRNSGEVTSWPKRRGGTQVRRGTSQTPVQKEERAHVVIKKNSGLAENGTMLNPVALIKLRDGGRGRDTIQN